MEINFPLDGKISNNVSSIEDTVTIFMNKTLNCPIPNPSPIKGREFGQRKF
jgi:hypothetical protein